MPRKNDNNHELLSRPVNIYPQLLQLITILQLHIPCLVHRFHIDREPALGLLHKLPLLVFLGLTPCVCNMDVLLLGHLIQLAPFFRSVVVDVFGVDVVVDFYAGGDAFECVGCTGSFKDEVGSCSCRGRGGEEGGEEGKDEEEEEGQEVRKGGGEVLLTFGAGGHGGTGASAWVAATKLVDADSWAAAEVEDEAWAGVHAACVTC